MANTFKTVTVAGVTSETTVYTAGGSVVATINFSVYEAKFCLSPNIWAIF